MHISCFAVEETKNENQGDEKIHSCSCQDVAFLLPACRDENTQLTCCSSGLPFPRAPPFLHVKTFILQMSVNTLGSDGCVQHAGGARSLEPALVLLTPDIKAGLKSGFNKSKVILILSLSVPEYNILLSTLCNHNAYTFAP